MEPLSPIIPCSRNIIDKLPLIKYLSNITLEHSINNSFFHINDKCPCLKLFYFCSNWLFGSKNDFKNHYFPDIFLKKLERASSYIFEYLECSLKAKSQKRIPI